MAIVIIAMLAVMAYLGINFASSGIAGNANTFYRDTHFRDIEIISTLLLTPDDIDAILAVEGVNDAEGIYQTSGKIESEDAKVNVDVVSLTERINTPKVLQGRLPKTTGECAAEQAVLNTLGLYLGDTVRVTDAQGAIADYLRCNEFVITGIVDHPDHACWPAQVPGNRDIVVLSEVFDRDALDGCFMKAEILLEGTAEADRFSEEYETAVAEVMTRLDTLSAERTEIRNNEIRSRYQNEIDAGRAELDAGRAELDEARAELDGGWTAMAEGEQTLADGAEQLADTEAQLQSAWQRIQGASAQLGTAKAKLDAAKRELDSGNAELYDAQQRLDAAAAELFDAWNTPENAKAAIRNAIRARVEEVCGDTTGIIPWAPRAAVNMDAGDTTAMDFWITTNFKLDLNKSLGENITAFIYSDAIPDELLEAGYWMLMGGAA